MKKALLVIGDQRVNRKKISPSFKQFVRYAQRLQDQGKIELAVISYARLLSGKAPQINNPSILVIFFFPYRYWNRRIEIYPDNRIYGDETFGRQFKAFFKKVEQAINKYYRGKKITYLNPPQACWLDRDKKASKASLERSAIRVPRTFDVLSFADIQRLLKRGFNLYIKPRFGALGKGMTYGAQEGIVSNFLFRGGKIFSRPYDYNWRFGRVKDEAKFVNQLIRRGLLCEEAIQPAIFKGKRFDFRVYVIFGRVVYLYAKSSPANFWVTNWSQGGKIDKRKAILRTLPQEKILQLKKLAKKAAAALNLNLAGIEIIFSQDLKVAYVLEGNAFPGYEKGFDLMKSLLKSVVK